MIRDGKKFIDNELRTEITQRDPGDVTTNTFTWGSAVDITYRSRFANYGTKTVRSVGAIEATDRDNAPEGSVAFWDDGKKYAYHPEEQVLYSLEGDSPRRISEDGGIVRIEDVGFKQRVPLDGAVQEGVEAEVYYWSSRSGNLTSVTIAVDRCEENTSNPWRLSGKDASDSTRRIEAEVRHEREITSKPFGGNKQRLGRVARVEFPKGHRYTVDLNGLPDDKARDAVENIKSRLTKRRGYDDVSVEHEGRIQRN